jgi:hypothetical protein
VEMVVDVVLDDFSDIDVLLMRGHRFSPELIGGRNSQSGGVLGLEPNAGAIHHNFVVPVPGPDGQDLAGGCHMAAHG